MRRTKVEILGVILRCSSNELYINKDFRQFYNKSDINDMEL